MCVVNMLDGMDVRTQRCDPDMIEVWKSGEGSKESREKRVLDLIYCGFFC
jgi:hypothetical protein